MPACTRSSRPGTSSRSRWSRCRPSPSQTLPLWLRGFLAASANRGVDWGQVMAASTLIAIPVIIFFVLVQNRMTSGLVSGAVKG